MTSVVMPVLRTPGSMDPLNGPSIQAQTLKIVMLMALNQAARLQTLHLYLLKNVSFGENCFSFVRGLY